MLVFNQARRKHDSRLCTADDACQFDCVGGANFKMRISVQFHKLNRCAEERGGIFCLGNALRRRAVSPCFTVRANDKMRRATGMGFFRNDTAASKLNVVGMRAEGQDSGTGILPVRFNSGFR